MLSLREVDLNGTAVTGIVWDGQCLREVDVVVTKSASQSNIPSNPSPKRKLVN